MKNLTRFVSFLITSSLVVITGCSNEPPKESCFITTGGQEYHYPDFSKDDCTKEVQSLIDKGIIDATYEWKTEIK